MKLYPHQEEALNKLKNGSVLLGDVGSGKSLTGLAYYHKVCGGSLNPYKERTKDIPLYIITTAKKRDDKEWAVDLLPFLLTLDDVVVDSWNNIKKYIGVKDAFFIFDEQRLVSYGTWTKTFLKIVKNNQWILLTATPGDTWNELMPLFLANGFYKNKTEFEEYHCEFNPFVKWKQVKRWHNVGRLMRNKKAIMVEMPFNKGTTQYHQYIGCEYDKQLYLSIKDHRQDPWTGEPFKNAAGLCYALRKVCNSDYSRIANVLDIWRQHSRIIIFYSFDYELDMLKKMCEDYGITYRQWNGHKHEKIPKDGSWLYLVNYMGGSEGWNCIECQTMIFFSQTYSYKIQHQAEGRIDRMNNKYKQLYYYHLISTSPIDRAISFALKRKKDFNERKFVGVS